jgi:protein-tyrosine kinase
MTKLYEALEQSSQKSIALKSKQVLQPVAPIISRTDDEKMANLYQNIQAALQGEGGKIVQFIGSRRGEGASTLIREFTKVVVQKLSKKVLLIDADQHNPRQPTSFGIKPECDWRMVIKENQPVHDALYQVENSNLYVSLLSTNTVPLAPAYDSPRVEKFFEQLRQEFDLILIDSPPGTTSADGLALTHKVDGVVVVVEAEKTRWEIAENIVNRMRKQGANILGVVVNKRRFPIPDFIYRRL